MHSFVTSESSNLISVVSAVTFADLGNATAPGATDLAGIAFDSDNNKLYACDRETTNLYVYDWISATNTLTPEAGSPYTLAGINCYGLALDGVNDLLYVSNDSTTVNINNTSDWSSAGTLTTNNIAVGIAVDTVRGFIYTGAGGGAGVGANNQLNQYNLSAGTQTSVTLPAGNQGVIGIGVDPDTGYIYLTTGSTGDDLLVYNSSLTLLHTEANIGNTPTAVVVPEVEISYEGDAPTTVPTLTEWGMIIFMFLAGLGAIYYLRRQRRVER